MLILDPGSSIPDPASRIPHPGSRIPDPASRIPDPASRIPHPGSCRIPGLMQDLTTGSLTRHLLKTTGFMLVTMIFQTLYFLIDLYWVGRLGKEAVAGVGIAGNLTFIVLALTQMLGVGTTTVVSHAVGRKNHDEALLLFNQSQVLAMVTGVVFLIVGMTVRTAYCNALGADPATAT